MAGRGSVSPAASKGDGQGRIPFIAVGEAEGDEWPKPVSVTKEAQQFIAQINGPICVLVCMGAQSTDKVRLWRRPLPEQVLAPASHASRARVSVLLSRPDENVLRLEALLRASARFCRSIPVPNGSHGVKEASMLALSEQEHKKEQELRGL